MTRTNEDIIRNLKRGASREVALSLLYQNNRPMLYKIAKKYGGNKFIDDLIQEGFIGLMRAVERYDPDHESGASFIHYAIPWIEQAVTRSIANYEPMRLPENERQNYFKYRKIKIERESKGLPCELEDMAQALEWTKQKTEEVGAYEGIFNSASLETPVGSEEDTTLMDMIPSQENIEEMALEPLYLDYRKAVLWNHVSKLDHEEREVITRYYRHDDNLAEIARSLQLSGGQVLNRREKGLDKLRAKREIRRLAQQESLIRSIEVVKKYPYHPVKTVLKRQTLDDLLNSYRKSKAKEIEEIRKRIEEQR